MPNCGDFRPWYSEYGVLVLGRKLPSRVSAQRKLERPAGMGMGRKVFVQSMDTLSPIPVDHRKQ